MERIVSRYRVPSGTLILDIFVNTLEYRMDWTCFSLYVQTTAGQKNRLDALERYLIPKSSNRNARQKRLERAAVGLVGSKPVFWSNVWKTGGKYSTL